MRRFIVVLALLFSLTPKATAIADTPVVVATPMDSRAVELGKFLESRNCPLLPYVDVFIASADKYKIDFRLLPSISVIESQCGKIFPRNTNNPFGWQSARVGFKSIPDAIDFITGQLANSKYYAGKTNAKKLAAYCPEPTYPTRVLNLMNQIK